MDAAPASTVVLAGTASNSNTIMDVGGVALESYQMSGEDGGSKKRGVTLYAPGG